MTRDPQLANSHPAGNAVLKLISARAPRICTEIQETRLFLQKLKKLLEVPLRVETQGRRHQKSEKGVSVAYFGVFLHLVLTARELIRYLSFRANRLNVLKGADNYKL